MNYYNKDRKPETIPAPPGNEEETVYKIKINETGHKIIYEAGTRNVYDAIQVDAETANIAAYVKRALNGDLTAINVNHGEYLDTTMFPKTLAEAHQMIFDLKETFNKLSAKEKENYNNDENQFVRAVSENIENEKGKTE